MTDQLWRRPRVEEETGLSRSTLYEKIKEGSFPSPVKIGKRAVAWPSSKVEAWKQEQLSQAA